MKENWSALSLSRRILLLVNAVMAAVFFLIYMFLGNRYVCRYGDILFDVTEENGAYTYAGEPNGIPVEITSLPDSTFSYVINGEEQGIFTVESDPSAVPESNSLTDGIYLEGVAVRRDGEVIFRGGFHKSSGGLLLLDQDLTPLSTAADYGEPNPHTILYFALFGEGVRLGNWVFFLVALSFSALTFLTAFFPEPFFRAHMALTKDERDHTKVPTYRKVITWVFWCALTLGALGLFIFGLFGF